MKIGRGAFIDWKVLHEDGVLSRHYFLILQTSHIKTASAATEIPALDLTARVLLIF
jgi:hypothetical protein